MDTADNLTLALWATNLAQPLNGLEAWAARVEERMAEARAEGADLLVMPEYMAEQWLSFAPAGLDATDEIAWMADRAPAALELLRPLVAKHGLALLAGTMPVRTAPSACEPAGTPPFRNRAYLLLPDGRVAAQDKLCLTPGEKDPAGWHLAAGDRIEVVTWRGLRLAILICLDVELPALASLLAPHELDLILVPSMTEKLSGHARVFGCAKARAVELLTTVGAVGCIGKAAASKPRLSNTSGAAVFLPCEEALGHRGIAAEVPPADSIDGPGPLLIARELPIGRIRALRSSGAEVWPGAWSAGHVTIAETCEPTSAPQELMSETS